MILIVVLYALWAASISASKILLTYTSPIFMTGIRMVLSGAVLLSFQYFYSHEHFHFNRKHIHYYLQIIVFGILISYFLRFWALEYITATKLLFLYNLAPFMTSLHSYFFLNEKMTRTKWLGMAIGTVGLLPMLGSCTKAETSLTDFFCLSWQDIAVIISVLTNSYSWVVMRKLIREQQYSPMMVNGICMFAGGAIALVIAFIWEGPCVVTHPLEFAAWLVFVIIISNIIAHNLYAYLLRSYTATFLSFAGCMGPLFAALYGWLFFDENVTWHLYVSTVIVFMGLYIFYKDEMRESIEVDV